MYKGSLPPLELLLPFEAAARLGSFTRAAEELSVTQSAVSQRVRTLEGIMGTALFIRAHRSITLTEEGRELFNGAAFALQHLSAVSRSVRYAERRPMVRLAVDVSMAALWLTPRLHRFLADAPERAVELSVSDVEAEVLSADVGVLHGAGAWAGFRAQRLFGDDVFAVCAPEYLERCPLSRPEDLMQADLIDLDYKNWNWMNWGIWLTEMGVEPLDASIVMRTNSHAAQIDAARTGLGVALGWNHLLDDDLQAGRLVRPLSQSVRTQNGYYAVVRDGAEAGAQDLFHALVADAKRL